MKKLNSGYIMSIVSSVVLLLEVIGVKVDVPYVNEVAMSILGVLIALGIVSGTKGNHEDKGKGKEDLPSSEEVDAKENSPLEEIASTVDDVIGESSDEDKTHDIDII